MKKTYPSIEEYITHSNSTKTFWDKFILHPKMNWLRWTIYNLPDVPKDIIRKCKRGYQRAYRGWSDEDTWNLDNYLAKVIKESLQHFRQNLSGCPVNLSEKDWQEMLDDMIYTFDRLQASSFDYVVIDDKRFKNGWKYFQKYFLNLWS